MGALAVLGAGALWWLAQPPAPENPANTESPAAPPPARGRRSALASVLHRLRETTAAGTVRGAHGQPIVDAHICTTAPIDLTRPLLESQQCARTDRDGYYQLSPLTYEEDRISITASARGYATQNVTVAATAQPLDGWGDILIDMTLEGAEFNVQGEVLDATGGVVPGARVRVLESHLSVATASDASGLFDLHLPPGQHRIIAEADGYAPTLRTMVAPTERLVLSLLPESRITGRVLGADGEPASDVQVLALPLPGRGLRATSLYPDTVSDGEGTFALGGLGGGVYRLLARADGYSGEVISQLGIGESQRDAVVHLEAAAALSGAVALPSRDALPCARWHLLLVSDLKPPRPPSVEWQQATPRALTHPQLAKLGEDGAFVLDDVPPGRYTAQLECQGALGYLTLKSFELSAGETLALGTLIPGSAQGLTVQVSDTQGQPAPSLRLFIEPVRDGQPHAQGSAPAKAEGLPSDRWSLTSDSEGRATMLGLPPGRYRIGRAVVGKQTDQVVEVPVHGLTGAQLKLDDTATLTVQVLDELDGCAQDDVSVYLERAGAGHKSAAPGPSADSAALAMEPLGLGRYQARHLPAGSYRVVADDGCNPPLGRNDPQFIVELKPADHRELTLETRRDALLQGVVVDDDGTPLPDVWVSAYADDAVVPTALHGLDGAAHWFEQYASRGCHALTDGEGQFLIPSVSSTARYRLHGVRAGGGEAVAGGVAPGDPVTLVLGAPLGLHGEVRGQDGQPAELLTVTAMLAGSLTAHTGRVVGPGRFEVDDLAPGRTMLSILASSGRRLNTEVVVSKATESGGLQLQLTPPSSGADTVAPRSPDGVPTLVPIPPPSDDAPGAAH